ncbi:hypothetical protein FHG87_019208 [Trinorchestia longiramus]|nr:hypothetical protein FHG87_019208 [Trinorchestia longiramus]
MLFSSNELTLWFGLSLLELLLFLVCGTITSVLVMLRLTGALFSDLSWLAILSPMFMSDSLNAYFCIIVLIRMYLYSMLRPGILRTMWSTGMIALSFIFKFLLCRRLEDPGGLEFSAVLAPIFIMLQMLMIRACHFKTSAEPA